MFTGYDTLNDNSVVVALSDEETLTDAIATDEQAKEGVLVVLDKTPFYAEMGGQAADHGVLTSADCSLRVLDVECSEWKMQGRRIHASCAPLPLSYIADIENADQFDPLFMDALATRLAEKLAMPLTGNQSLRQNLNQEFHKIILPQAATVNAVQCFSNDSHPLLDLLRKIKSPSCPEECE